MIFQKHPANNRKKRCNSIPKVFRHTRKTAIVPSFDFYYETFLDFRNDTGRKILYSDSKNSRNAVGNGYACSNCCASTQTNRFVCAAQSI